MHDGGTKEEGQEVDKQLLKWMTIDCSQTGGCSVLVVLLVDVAVQFGMMH